MSGGVFSWSRRSDGSWRLAGCILLMLFLHSGAFFIFQAALPQQSTAPRTAPPLQILTPFDPDGSPSPENVALLRWIETEDPAIIARVPVVEPPDLLNVPYRPSFATPATPPLPAPATPVTIQFPPARDPLSVIMGRGDSEVPANAPPAAPQATRIEFSQSLKSRAEGLPSMRAGKLAKSPVSTSEFLLGVGGDGAVRFFFLQQPCGEPLLDEAASAWLRRLKLGAADGAELTWGSVVFHWGDDVMAEEN